MARSALKFSIRIDLPGQNAGDDASFISYEQMMNTLDKAYDRGEKAGVIMHAVIINDLAKELGLEAEAGRLLSAAADDHRFPSGPVT